MNQAIDKQVALYRQQQLRGRFVLHRKGKPMRQHRVVPTAAGLRHRVNVLRAQGYWRDKQNRDQVKTPVKITGSFEYPQQIPVGAAVVVEEFTNSTQEDREMVNELIYTHYEDKAP